MRYSDLQRVDKMCVTTRKLLDYLKDNGITQVRILEEEPLRWAITTPLFNIGEQAYQISDDFKAKHVDIPWSNIAGLRHRLVHDYDNTNWSLICTVLFEVLPGFLSQIEDIRDKTE